MKKIKYAFLILLCILIAGCSSNSENKIIKKFDKKINSVSSYLLNGDLEIYNNEDVYKYKVESLYKKNENYKVTLTNEINNHKQIILKNQDGVFVLNPTLNKSYKFQTDWPFNNSQVYLLQTIIKDLKNKEERIFTKEKNYFVFKVKTNYLNNNDLSFQKITLDKQLNLKKVEVFDKNNELKMKMTYNKIDFDYNIEEDIFKIKSYETEKTTNFNLKSTIYPMFLPNNTKLTGQNKIETENGERVILTFNGEKPFIVIEETINSNNEMITIPITGDPELITDSVGVVDNGTVTWVSNDVEFHVISDKLSNIELMEIANSINVKAVGK